MSTSNFNLRGITPDVMLFLKNKAKDQHVSVNMLILQLIEQGLDVNKKKKRSIHHELDHLAGTWSKEEARAFEKNIQAFEVLDEELWK